jgi:hypothetical protein
LVARNPSITLPLFLWANLLEGLKSGDYGFNIRLTARGSHSPAQLIGIYLASIT